MSLIKQLSTLVLDAILPRVCPVCDRALVAGEDVLCVGCLEKLPRLNLHKRPFNEMHQRIAGQVYITDAVAWFSYNSESDYAVLIREGKYEDLPARLEAMGRMMAQELLDDGYKPDVDVLVPVPMHWLKKFKRGFNQSEEIAKGLASIWGIPIANNLKAIRGHKTQTRQGGEARAANVGGIFKVVDGDMLAGKRVAIVDDIVTTGSTLRECVATLSGEADIIGVSVLALAMTKLKY